MTSKKTIGRWLIQGREKGIYSHMLVLTDTFDYTDYPIYCENRKAVENEIEFANTKELTKIMEVYNYSLSLKKQLDEHRVWNI